jgi:hypothetical protein
MLSGEKMLFFQQPVETSSQRSRTLNIVSKTESATTGFPSTLGGSNGVPLTRATDSWWFPSGTPDGALNSLSLRVFVLSGCSGRDVVWSFLKGPSPGVSSTFTSIGNWIELLLDGWLLWGCIGLLFPKLTDGGDCVFVVEPFDSNGLRYSGNSSICFSIGNSDRFTIGVSRFGHGDARTAKTHITRHTVMTCFIVFFLFNLKMKNRPESADFAEGTGLDWRSSCLDASIKYKAGA